MMAKLEGKILKTQIESGAGSNRSSALVHVNTLFLILLTCCSMVIGPTYTLYKVKCQENVKVVEFKGKDL